MSDDFTDLERQLEARDVLGVRKLISAGIETERFLKSPVGTALIDRAYKEQLDAMDLLAAVDPLNASAVMQAQLAYRTPAAVLQWIGDFLAACNNAETQFIEADALRG